MTHEIIQEIKQALLKRQTQIVLKLLNELDAELEARLISKQELWNDLKSYFMDLSEIDEESINQIKKKHNLE